MKRVATMLNISLLKGDIAKIREQLTQWENEFGPEVQVEVQSKSGLNLCGKIYIDLSIPPTLEEKKAEAQIKLKEAEMRFQYERLIYLKVLEEHGATIATRPLPQD